MTKLAHLAGRGVIAVGGADRVAFLNGLVSNEVGEAAPGRAVWAALLTPQGKYLADFFILAEQDRLLLDCEAALMDMLVARLSRYRLRALVEIAATDLRVGAAWGAPPVLPGAIVAPDPRLPEAGWRVLGPDLACAHASFDEWDRHRLRLGLPDGTRDMEPEKTVLLEAGFDELNGVSWTKGCYMGQELTARTRYRGLLKRRLLPVQGAARLPPAGTPILAGEREVGQMRSSLDGEGLALLRLDALQEGELTAAGIALSVNIPSWAKLPAAA
jgi:folate-binding protein YgfZ